MIKVVGETITNIVTYHSRRHRKPQSEPYQSTRTRRPPTFILLLLLLVYTAPAFLK